MRRHCLVTLGNRCTTAEVPVPPHKARIFGMSDEQVLCIIHLCSIFHVQEQESGFGVYRGVGWGGVGGGPLCQTAGSVWCFSSGGLSVRSYFRSTCLCLFRHMSFMDFHPMMLA